MRMMQHRKDLIIIFKGKGFFPKEKDFLYIYILYIYSLPPKSLCRKVILKHCFTGTYENFKLNKKVTAFHEIRAKK